MQAFGQFCLGETKMHPGHDHLAGDGSEWCETRTGVSEGSVLRFTLSDDLSERSASLDFHDPKLAGLLTTVNLGGKCRPQRDGAGPFCRRHSNPMGVRKAQHDVPRVAYASNDEEIRLAPDVGRHPPEALGALFSKHHENRERKTALIGHVLEEFKKGQKLCLAFIAERHDIFESELVAIDLDEADVHHPRPA